MRRLTKGTREQNVLGFLDPAWGSEPRLSGFYDHLDFYLHLWDDFLEINDAFNTERRRYYL